MKHPLIDALEQVKDGAPMRKALSKEEIRLWLDLFRKQENGKKGEAA